MAFLSSGGSSCHAWVNWNGEGTPAIRDDYNVSSISDQGTGRYRVNLSDAFADTNFAFAGSGGRSNGDANCHYGEQVQHRTSSRIEVMFQDVQNNTRDTGISTIAFWGNN
jgi:hypothetical protein